MKYCKMKYCKIAEELNTFFINALSTLDINENSSIINQNFQSFDDPVDRAIDMYKYQSKNISIINISKVSIPPKMLKISS